MAGDTEFDFHEPWDLAIAAALVILSGLVAGLTIGIMGIDQLELMVMSENSDIKDKTRLERLMNLLQRHHLILVALLIVNTICQETLPLFLNRMFPEWATIVFAVTIVLLFGEIIPQAVCSGQYRIRIITIFSPFILCLTWIFWPLAWPIAKLLDKLVGIHGDKYYGRADLKTVVRLHEKGARLEELARQGSSAARNDDSEVEKDGLLADEVIVIEGALDMAKKGAKEIMVAIDNVYALEESAVIDEALRRAIVDRGHSRIPVYRNERTNIIDILYVKTLVADPVSRRYSPESEKNKPLLVRDFLDRRKCPKFIKPDHRLYDLMNDLQTGRHLALVTSDPVWHTLRWEANEHDLDLPSDEKRIQGIVTIEDIFEELIQEEIYDEFDKADPPTMTANATSLSVIVKAMKMASGVDDAIHNGSIEGLELTEPPQKMVGVIKLTKPNQNLMTAPSSPQIDSSSEPKEEV